MLAYAYAFLNSINSTRCSILIPFKERPCVKQRLRCAGEGACIELNRPRSLWGAVMKFDIFRMCIWKPYFRHGKYVKLKGYFPVKWLIRDMHGSVSFPFRLVVCSVSWCLFRAFFISIGLSFGRPTPPPCPIFGWSFSEFLSVKLYWLYAVCTIKKIQVCPVHVCVFNQITWKEIEFQYIGYTILGYNAAERPDWGEMNRDVAMRTE